MRLPDAERRHERGAWFGSIHKTLNHILWGDQSWMGRFTDLPRPTVGIPDSVALFPDWQDLKSERAALRPDNSRLGRMASMTPGLPPIITYYSGATKREWTRPRWVLVTHMFNHQTHHRGQVHSMLTQAGGRPSDTDLPFMPD